MSQIDLTQGTYHGQPIDQTVFQAELEACIRAAGVGSFDGGFLFPTHPRFDGGFPRPPNFDGGFAPFPHSMPEVFRGLPPLTVVFQITQGAGQPCPANGQCGANLRCFNPLNETLPSPFARCMPN